MLDGGCMVLVEHRVQYTCVRVLLYIINMYSVLGFGLGLGLAGITSEIFREEKKKDNAIYLRTRTPLTLVHMLPLISK